MNRNITFTLACALVVAGCNANDSGDAGTGASSSRANAGGAGPSATGAGTGTGSGMQPPVDPSCHLDGAAFCDAFMAPSPGGRAGTLDDAKWGFARLGFGASNDSTFSFPQSPINVCGTWQTVMPGGPDSDFCTGEDGVGRWTEGFDDNTSFNYFSARIRQPFDFAGRTGKFQWEADARTSGTHGWWVEVWFSEAPVPGPNFHAPDQLVSAPNAVGVVLGLNCGVDAANLGTAGAGKMGVSEIDVVHDYTLEHVYNGADVDNTLCVDTEQNVLNKLQFEVSENHIEVLGTDAGGSDYVSLGGADIQLPFSRAYISLSHVHYNAHKVDVSMFQSYQWARVAFDGPQLPTPRAYSVPDSLSPTGSGNEDITVYHVGYGNVDGVTYDFDDGPTVPKALVLAGVDKTGAAGARLIFNTSRVVAGNTLQYRFNGGAWRDYVVPNLNDTWERQGFVIPVDLADLADGDNTIEFSTNSSELGPNSMHIANIDLELDVP